MSSQFEYWIGRRYVRAGSRNGFVSIISAISMLGIAVAVAVLIIVLSVVNGFERELRDRLLAMTAHASIEGTDDRLSGSELWLGTAERQDEVLAAAPYITGQGLLMSAERLSGAELRGVDPSLETVVSGIDTVMQEGELTDLVAGEYRIVLGRELANVLQAEVGDTVTLTLAEGIVTPAGLVPRSRRFTVSGIYRVGMFEFDRRLAFLNITDAAKMFRMRDDVSGIRLSVDDVFNAPSVVRQVAIAGGGGVLVSDWTRRNINFFRSIQITKSILFVILLLVVAVAAFNIVSTLVMVVKEKQSDIAILRTIGARRRDILRVFITQGTIIGVLGTLAGVFLGVVVALNLEAIVAFFENSFGLKFLAADVYFISDLPSDLRAKDVLQIASIALVLSLLSTLYPAWRGSKTLPAEALRYD